MGEEGGAGKWHGHLVAVIGNERLLDATVDQSHKPEWGVGIGIDPLVLPISAEFLDPSICTLTWASGRYCSARYCVFPRQTGFVRAPDARPSHWMPLAERIAADWCVKE